MADSLWEEIRAIKRQTTPQERGLPLTLHSSVRLDLRSLNLGAP